LISVAHKFLFVHIPKTAGNSIQNVLRAYSEDKIVSLAPHQDGVERFEVRSDTYAIHKHSTLRDYRAQLGDADFRRMFKFTSVRNPWDRMVSFYFSAHRGAVEWNRKRFEEMIQRAPSVAASVSLDMESDSGSFGNMDYFIRYENLNDDFKSACELIGIPWEPLSIRNKSPRQPYSVYYDEELIDAVRQKFAAEIEYFGYTFEGCP
jgi:hypothetical protein